MQPAYRKREADLDEWTLRAKREKALMHEERNLFWEDDQISRWQPDTINLTELNDSRAVREWCASLPPCCAASPPSATILLILKLLDIA